MPQPLSPPHADALPATTQPIYRALGYAPSYGELQYAWLAY